MKQVTFRGELCNVDTSKTYFNGRAVIKLTIAETGEPMAIATANLPETPLKSDEVIIKNYSENEGIFKILCDAGIIEPTNKRTSGAFVTCEIAKLKT